MNEFGVEEKTWADIIEIFKKINEIEKVILFGSRAKGTYKKTSDIDLAVKFNESNKKLLLIRSLDEVRCILKFDVLDIDKVENEKLLNNIRKDGKVIYEKILN